MKPLHRKYMRLEGYDYTLPGAYFVTICADRPVPLFGRVEADHVRLNAIGRIVQTALREMPAHYRHVQLDAHVVMPDHLHAILMLNLDNAYGIVEELTPTLPQLMQRLKSLTGRRYGDWRRAHPQVKLPEKLWQRGYYDRIMRDEDDLNEKRNYILTNPPRWTLEHQSHDH